MNTPNYVKLKKRWMAGLYFLCCFALLASLLPQPLSAAPAVAEQYAPLAQADCPAGPSGLPDVVDRDKFCVRYNDSNTSNTQAVQVADLTQQYWDRYTGMGFLEPLFTDKLVVEVRNDASCNGATGASLTYMYMNNGCFNTPNAMQQTTGHELFHRVQYSYDNDASSGRWHREGTARAMEDMAFANIDNWAQTLTAPFSFNQQVNTYLNNRNVDITSDPQRYNSALWWKYFSEQYGTVVTEPERGVDAFVAMWEATQTQDDIAAVNSALANLGAGETFDSAFQDFAAANWLKDLTGASTTFNYVDEDEVGSPAPYGPIMPIDGGTISSGSSAIWNNQPISRYGAEYYGAAIGADCPVVNASFNTDSGPAFYHVVTQDGGMLEYFGTISASSWSQSFYNTGLTNITAIAGSTNGSAQVDITLRCVDPVIDVMMPNDQAVAHVGPSNGPGKFLAQVSVTDGSPTGPVVDGLTVNDFKASVDGVEALVTAGGFIQEQYWLVVQAPILGADGTYDLEVRLEESGTTDVIATDTNAESVVYTPDNVDHLLVLDRSGSMNSDGKFVAAQNAANFYIDITRNSDGLAVIPYETNVDPAPFDLREVSVVPNVRQAAEDYVDALNTGNLTSIGDGLLEAATQRNATPTGNPLCSFVLLSDGIETANEYWIDVDEDVIATGCPVTTIAFGQDSDETLMQNIATATGGQYFYNDVFVSADGLSAASINSADSLAEMNLDLGNTYEYAQALGAGRVRLLQDEGIVPILQSEFELPPDQVHSVFVDDTVDEILFALDWHSSNEPDCDNPQVSNGCFGKDLELRLIAPDGTEIRSDKVPYTFEDIVSGHVGWYFDDPMDGEWTLVVNADSFYVWYDIPYQVIVSGPSSLTAELLTPSIVGDRYVTGNRVPIRAFVSSDVPLPDAQVIAEVTAPDGTTTTVPLYDDGAHDDGAASDGFYNGYYTQVTQAQIGRVGNGEEGGKPIRDPLDEGSYQVRLLVQLDEIQREALGAFSVREGEDLNNNGLPDVFERENDVNGASSDADLDGLDAASEYQLGTDPNNSDTDGGGENDGSEFNKGQDPLNARDDNVDAPEYLTVVPYNGFTEIRYHVRDEYVRRILFRATSTTGPWQVVNSELPKEGIYDDEKVDNDTTYFYRYLGINDDGHGSEIISSIPVTPSEDPHAPEAQIVIDKGASETTDLDVTLNFTPYGHVHEESHDDEDEHEHEKEPERFEDIKEMRISNSPLMEKSLQAAAVEWQPFAQDVAWTLEPTEPDEIATVYAQFRDGAGNESLIFQASILVVEPPPNPDVDDDGIPNDVEGTADSDNDGTPDAEDEDSDDDDIPDSVEGTADSDNDGTPDRIDLDSDDDGKPDKEEGAGDVDGDGIPNYRDNDDDLTTATEPTIYLPVIANQ